MTDIPTITADLILAHLKLDEAIQARLAVLGKEVHFAKQKAVGSEPYSTVVNGRFDNWSVDKDPTPKVEDEDDWGDEPKAPPPATYTVSVRFYVTGRYSYEDWHTVEFPLTWLEDDGWRAELEAEAVANAARQKRNAADRARAKEKQEREQLAALQKKYPSQQAGEAIEQAHPFGYRSEDSEP